MGAEYDEWDADEYPDQDEVRHAVKEESVYYTRLVYGERLIQHHRLGV